MRVLLAGRPDHERRKFDEHEKQVRSLAGQGDAQWDSDFERLTATLWRRSTISCSCSPPCMTRRRARTCSCQTPTRFTGIRPSIRGASPTRSHSRSCSRRQCSRTWTDKIEHKNPEVRAKAERLIRGVKEYRRRGSLADGVTIARGVSSVATIATEPRMGDSLYWLDAANDDDRIIASVLEVMRVRPRSAVVLVTRDINMQNKADYGRIPFVEPPDP